MAEIVESVEISRRPEDVFSYVADPSHHPEWIESVVSVRREGDGPLAVGSRVVATRAAVSAASRSSPLPTAWLSCSITASGRA